MVGGTHGMGFPGLYGRWTGHDLADRGLDLGIIRPGFYEGLRREDEPLVWRFIENNYLLRYRDFLRVEHEWTAEGLWRIPFPGSVRMGEFRSPVDYGMPAPLAARLRAWQDNLDTRDPFAEPDDEDFDYEASDAEGLEISKEVKLFLGHGYYVEYWPFREISIKGGEAVELEVPAFITGLAR